MPEKNRLGEKRKKINNKKIEKRDRRELIRAKIKRKRKNV